MEQQPDFGTQQPYGSAPETEKKRNWTWWVGGGCALLFACLLIGGSLVWLTRQFLDRTAVEPPPLIVPTSALTPAPTAVSTQLSAAATVTLPAVPTPPLGGGQVDARLAVVPPTVDGDLSEWPEGPTAVSGFRVHAVPGWDGSEDATAVWRLAWDATHLYVAVAVADDTLVQTQTGNLIFRGDSLEMQIDTDRPGDWGQIANVDDFQIALSPGNFSDIPPSAFLFRGTSNNQVRDAPGGNRIQVAAQPTADGYTVEAAVPWSDLSVTPSSAMVMGLALNVNDNDTPGTAVQEVMFSHVASRTFRDPGTWGTLELLPAQ